MAQTLTPYLAKWIPEVSGDLLTVMVVDFAWEGDSSLACNQRVLIPNTSYMTYRYYRSLCPSVTTALILGTFLKWPTTLV